MRYLFSVALSLFLMLSACVYEPEQFVESEKEENPISSNSMTDMGSLYAVNDGKQICNPSVSQDTVNFPASMLWLNFSGTLVVNKHDSDFTVKGVLQHDRLTVSDSANNVKWFLMRDTSKGECQFQDPEWSTHAEYIVALRGYDVKGRKTCENLDYGIFAVRMSDKKRFWFYEKGIIEEATPHIWVEPSVKAEKDGDVSTVKGFFGTDNVRLTYVNEKQNIVFVDYANGGLKKAKKLKKPANRTDWNIDSPLISPDGNYVVYNMVESSTNWEAYIQELSEKSTAVKLPRTKEMISEPAQPHWFEYDGRLFVVWAEFPAGSQMLNKTDLNAAQDGSVGRTVMREVHLSAGAPKDFAVEWIGENREIAPVPMTGGRSPDGKFLATGTNKAYLLELP